MSKLKQIIENYVSVENRNLQHEANQCSEDMLQIQKECEEHLSQILDETMVNFLNDNNYLELTDDETYSIRKYNEFIKKNI